MELALKRQDYFQVNSCSHRDTMVILPKSKKGRQYITIGDDSGEINTFDMKRGEKKQKWRSIVNNAPKEEGGRKIHGNIKNQNAASVESTEITALSLSGVEEVKIYVSTENDVYGISTSKGKEAGTRHFESNMTEVIENLNVQLDQYWTSGEYVFSMHEYDNDGTNEQPFKERVFYSCQDRINDFDIKKITAKPNSLKTGILGCDDGTIRTVDGKTGELEAEVNVKKSVTRIYIPKMVSNGVGITEENYVSSNDVIFGTRRGNMGAISFNADNEAKKLWDVKGKRKSNSTNSSPKGIRQAAITCIQEYDMTEDGRNDYIVGREDGSIQVYVKRDEDSKPFENFRSSVQETIQTLAAGFISSPENKEIIINTFSGRVMSFKNERDLMEKVVNKKGYTSTVGAKAKEETLQGLDTELKELRKEVQKETKNLRKQMGTEKNKDSNAYSIIRSLDMQFKVKVVFDLLQDDAAYKLGIECSTPIEQIILKSDIPVDIMDMDDTETIVSITNTNSQQHGPQPILATFRNDQMEETGFINGMGQDNNGETESKTKKSKSKSKKSEEITYLRKKNPITSKRMELKVRTVEGQAGAITLYVIPANNENIKDEGDEIKFGQTAHSVTIGVMPLSLHCRTERPKIPIEKMPLNILELQGYSSINQVHEWLRNILPNFPRRAMDQQNQAYFYENSLVGSLLAIEYLDNKVLLSSDSISTISILKETINRLAMRVNVRISLSIRINEMSVVRFLALVEPKLQAQLGLATKIKWLDGLAEVTGGGNPSYLSTELRNTLNNAKQIKYDFKRSAKFIQFWYGVITDLYIDLNRCRGVNASHNIPNLMNALENFNMDNILKFFGVKRGDIDKHFEQAEKDEMEMKLMEKKRRKERKKKKKKEKEKKLQNRNNNDEKSMSGGGDQQFGEKGNNDKGVEEEEDISKRNEDTNTNGKKKK